MKLSGRVAVVTGAAAGIGESIGRHFCREGATVIFTDVDAAGVQESARIAKEKYGNADWRQLNVTNRADVEACFENIIAQYGKIDILVNNAGITRDALLLNMSDEDFWDVINVNLIGTFYCGRTVLKYMKTQKSGVVINIASICGLMGNVGQTNYSASKFGIIGMSRTWAKEFGRYGIRVNCIAPSGIQTNMMSTIPEKILEATKAVIPLRRFGVTDEIALPAVFLASDDASYITGATLDVTGGLLA